MRIAVIGAGAAGAAAAHKLRTRRHDVTVFYRAPAATALSSGCIDLVPASYFEIRSMTKAFEKFKKHHRHHVFHRMGINYDGITKALMDWSRYVDNDSFQFVGDFEKGLLLLNTWGLPKWCVMAQSTLAAGDMRRWVGKTLGVVLVEGAPWIHERTFLMNAARVLGDKIRWQVIRLPIKETWKLNGEQPFQWARRMDQEILLEEIGRHLKAQLPSGLAGLALPPVFGYQRVSMNVRALEKQLGLPCFELSATQDSVPGMRLHHAVIQSLEKFQIPSRKETVRSVSTDSDGVHVIFGEEAHQEALIFDKVLLATGRYLSGGLKMSERGPVESLQGRETQVYLHEYESWKKNPEPAHSKFPRARALFGPSFFESQPGLTVGVDNDANLVNSEKVQAVGSLLGGYDASADQAGMAAAIVTAHQCAESL